MFVLYKEEAHIVRFGSLDTRATRPQLGKV